jgi:hypothetical protein
MSDELEKELKEVEVSIAELQTYVERKEKLKRLMANKDFQELIEEQYLIQEASRMLLLRDDPNLPANKKAFLEADLYGPGAFKRYLSTIFQMGTIAENNIVELHDTMEEINDQIANGEAE